jgi:frataxin-like iron-binding protein CyaY
MNIVYELQPVDEVWICYQMSGFHVDTNSGIRTISLGVRRNEV